MSRVRQSGAEPPAKRAKWDGKGGYKFTSADEIRRGLRSQDQDGLTEALTALRNQLSVNSGEIISLQDERLLLAQHWMEIAPGAQDLFEAWEGSNQRQMSLVTLFVSVLSSLVVLLSSHYTYHSLGLPIVKTLLAPQWMRRIHSNLSGSHNELILVTLRLLNAMSTFASGQERKSVLEAFAWDTKSMTKLLFMRRKSKQDVKIDVFNRPDIRTLYVQLILSFVDQDTSITVKSAFLERHREFFLSIFKGIVQDPYLLIHKILEVCWAGIWSDPKIKKTLKIGLFNESTIFHLTKLYDRTGSENSEMEHVPADLVHHFLLAICTRPGVGICFKDRGWYPRESDRDDEPNIENESGHHKSGKIYNKILANLLKTLKVNEDSRQQELALKIMTTCPELVSGYWSGAALTLEPRLSSKWIANIAFFGSVISLPVPSNSFLLPESSLFQPSPPPLSSFLENIFPSVNTKNNMSKGLQSTSSLVQHCTALALAKCLTKYAHVMDILADVKIALEEDDEGGQWSKRERDLATEIRRRVPDFQVIVGYAQQKLLHTDDHNKQANTTKANLLSESAQRILWLYHRCIPSLAAEARFDVGKLLQSFSKNVVGDDAASLKGSSGQSGLQIIKELHILRMLKQSDQFIWSGKTTSSPHSYLYTLLKAYNTTEVSATRLAIKSLLKKILSDSILFQEDGAEVYHWIDSLPTSRRAPGAESPDGAALTDEGDSVIFFLDDCVQRCLKTPYRYLEDREALVQSTEEKENTEETTNLINQENIICSPLLFTVLDQLMAKLGGKLLSPSDVLAITTFVRKLVLKLSGKLQNLTSLSAIIDRVDKLLHLDLFPQYPNIMTAIRREIPMMRLYLVHLQAPPKSQPSSTSAVVQHFLARVEQLPIPDSLFSRLYASYELSDWLRLTGNELHSSEVERLLKVVERFFPSALRDFLLNLGPGQGSVWDIRTIELKDMICLGFDSLFIVASPATLQDESRRGILVEALFRPSATKAEIQSAICLIDHSISNTTGNDTAQKDLLLLVASIVETAEKILLKADFTYLKGHIYTQYPAIKSLYFSHTASECVRQGIERITAVSLDPASEEDRKLASDFSLYWVRFLITGASQGRALPASAIIWVKYLEIDSLLALMDAISGKIHSHLEHRNTKILEAVLISLESATASDPEQLGQRLDQIMALRAHIPQSIILEKIIASAVSSCLPIAYDGQPIQSSSGAGSHLGALCKSAEAQWKCRWYISPENLDLSTFLMQKPWSNSIARIVSGLLYKRPASRKMYLDWLATDHIVSVAVSHLTMTTYAYLDSTIHQEDGLADTENDILTSHFSFLLSNAKAISLPPDLSHTYVACLYMIIQRLGFKRLELLTILKEHIQSSSTGQLDIQYLILGRRLYSHCRRDAEDCITSLIDRCLSWAVQLFSSSNAESESAMGFTNSLTGLVSLTSHVKGHLVEPVMAAVIQNCLNNAAAVKLITALLSHTQLKPASINRYLQSIVQNPQFFKVCADPITHDVSHPRQFVVEMLHVLFNLHPNNTCQPSHIEPLVFIYGGSLSLPDRQLLSIFQLFENQRKSSVVSVLARWASDSKSTSATSLDALLSLDPIRVLQTCLAYPMRRSLIETPHRTQHLYDAQVYDPVFVMLLFGHALLSSPPNSTLAWIELFRTNVVSLIIRSLSAKEEQLRRLALSQLTILWKCLETADMQEKLHVLYILDQLKDTLPTPSEEPLRRLPSYTTLIVLHALRGVFYPSNFIYPLTARFLLQRAEIDTGDVPMLYSMLYNSTDDWKKERGWIIRFLSDGMMSEEDWRVFKRRHTWELLSSMFQNSQTDHALRNGVLEVLANLTSNSQATTSLILKSSLLSWIEMQLKSTKRDERVAWAKILENIMVILNPAKLDTSLAGQWRSIICRCISLLICKDEPTTALTAILPVVFRLSLLPDPPTAHLLSLVDRMLRILRVFEEQIELPVHDQGWPSTRTSTLPPYGAFGLHETQGQSMDPLLVWGNAVEVLWRITMSLPEKGAAWDGLTSRLLIWRAIVGADDTNVGEWARREVVQNVQNL